MKKLKVFSAVIIFSFPLMLYDALPQYIRVISPGKGETLYKTNLYVIRWMSIRVKGKAVIELYRKGEKVTDIADASAVTGSYIWRVGANRVVSIPEGQDFRIKISSKANRAIFGESSSFSIARPEINVVYPNGGEILTKGEWVTIRWTTRRLSGNVILYAVKGNSVYHKIASNYPNIFSYRWKVLPLSSEEGGEDSLSFSPGFTIKIVSSYCPEVFDESDGLFVVR